MTVRSQGVSVLRVPGSGSRRKPEASGTGVTDRDGRTGRGVRTVWDEFKLIPVQGFTWA